MTATPPLTVAVVGATATGKTALAVALARRLGDAELVNADSRQLFAGLQVGTCAPNAEERRGVTWHLLGTVEPGAAHALSDWLACARDVLAELHALGRRAIVTGGTGLYVSALLDGYELADAAPDPVLRRRRTETAGTPQGLDALVAELRRRDPGGAAAVDLHNPRRVIRALEVVDAAGAVQAGRRRGAPEAALRLGVDVDAATHRDLVERRARAMVEEGALVAEIAAALDRGVPRETLLGCGIGYAEGLALLDGELGPEAAVEAISRRTLRYAKAQRTWFRRDPAIVWIRREAGTAWPEGGREGALAHLDAAEHP